MFILSLQSDISALQTDTYYSPIFKLILKPTVAERDDNEEMVDDPRPRC